MSNGQGCGVGTVEGDVSVVIVNYNAQKTLLRCLRALQGQTLNAAKVIVVDNASTDDSVNAARKLFPQFEYVCLDTNIGFAAANNLAIKCCDSEFVALLNPDAFPERDWLHELVSVANRTPGAASWGSCQLVDDKADVIDGVGDICHISGLVWRDGHGCPRDADDSIEREIFSPCAAAALYRTQVIQDLGGFDEDFFCYVEDVDLGFRLRLMGWQSWYVPSAVVRHVGSATSGGSHSHFSVYHGHRNLVWMYVKNMPGYLFWLFLPLHLVMNICSVLWFLFQGKAGTILLAKKDAIRSLPKVWRKRAIVQGLRCAPVGKVFSLLNKGFLPGDWQGGNRPL